jgi:hypothetical protein
VIHIRRFDMDGLEDEVEERLNVTLLRIAEHMNIDPQDCDGILEALDYIEDAVRDSMMHEGQDEEMFVNHLLSQSEAT